jgi:hypothetical protein
MGFEVERFSIKISKYTLILFCVSQMNLWYGGFRFRGMMISWGNRCKLDGRKSDRIFTSTQFDNVSRVAHSV